MRRISVLLLLFFFGITLAPVLLAQDYDPSDTFLQAYTAFQKGGKQEDAGDYQPALENYKSAAALLQKVHEQSPEWQPAVVTYRLRKIAEAITLLEVKISQKTAGLGKTPDVQQPVVTGS